MKPQKTFWQRLKEVFYPPVESLPITIVRAYPGTEDEFFEWLAYNDFKTSRVLTEAKSKIYIYTSGDTGEIIACAIRWPNRTYYYTIKQC